MTSGWRRWDGPTRSDQQFSDGAIDEAIAHDSAIALGHDRLAGSEVAQGLRDGGIGEAGGCGEIGNADRPRGVDTAEQGQPGGVGQKGKPSRAVPDGLWVVEGCDGLADPFAVDDTLMGSLRRQQMHVVIMSHPSTDHLIRLDRGAPAP